MVRLACPCGRNLADVRLTAVRPELPAPPGHVTMRLPERPWPFARPGVRQGEHHHGSDRFTFRWDCRCGRTWEVRYDRIEAIWREYAQVGHVIRLTLGRDAM